MKLIFDFGTKLSNRMAQIALDEMVKSMLSRQSGKTDMATNFIRTKLKEIGFARKIRSG